MVVGRRIVFALVLHRYYYSFFIHVFVFVGIRFLILYSLRLLVVSFLSLSLMLTPE